VIAGDFSRDDAERIAGRDSGRRLTAASMRIVAQAKRGRRTREQVLVERDPRGFTILVVQTGQ
jgi:hypothetical protein